MIPPRKIIYQNDTYQISYSLVFLFNISNLYSGNVFCFRVSANLIRSVKNWCCCGFCCIILYIFKWLIDEWVKLWSNSGTNYDDLLLGSKIHQRFEIFLKDQNLIQLFYGFLKEYHFYSALKPFLFHKKWKEKKKHIKKKFSPFYYISLLAFLFKRHVSRIELWTL